MLKRYLAGKLKAFSNQFDYNVDYLQALLDKNVGAFIKFYRLQGATAYRKGIPVEPYYAAKIRAALTEDCGPCTQLAVNMALQAGLEPKTVSAILNRDFNALADDTALVVRFTEHTLSHDPAASDLRDEIVAKWGDDGLISLALCISMSRVYPTVKYVLGYGEACQRITVADSSFAPVRAPYVGAK